MQEAAPWISIAIAAAVFLYTVIANSSKASSVRLRMIEQRLEQKVDKSDFELVRTQIAAGVGRVDIVEDRTSRIETEMDHMPDKDAMHTLALQVSEQRSDIRALAQSVDNIRRSVDDLSKTIENGSEAPTHHHRRS